VIAQARYLSIRTSGPYLFSVLPPVMLLDYIEDTYSLRNKLAYEILKVASNDGCVIYLMYACRGIQVGG
jgi:hypothetical protein